MTKIIKVLQLLVFLLVVYSLYFFWGDNIRSFYRRQIEPRISNSLIPSEERITSAARCRDNLRKIDRAKTRWAESNNKIYGEKVSESDLLPYLSSEEILQCPDGGRYTLHPYGTLPGCSIGNNANPEVKEDNHIIGMRE